MGFESIFKLSVILNMVDNLSSPLRQAQSSSGEFVSSMQRASSVFNNMTQTGVGMAALGAEITSGLMAPVEATFATKKAIGELTSLGVKDLATMESAAKSFSNTWAGTTKADFITAAYDIKSGIASLSDTGVAQYTELSGLTAKATKSTIAEMTDLFATGYGIYKDYYSGLSDMEFGEVFSAGISKSVQQFKTNGSQMAASIKTLGASATTAQVPLEEQLSVLGMLQATMSGSEAGTKYKAFLRSAAKGGAELGLSFMDANNQLLSMPEILDQLRGKFGDTMDAAEKMELQKAFGDTEAVALIDLMYSKTGELQDNILAVYDSMRYGTGVAHDMASAINETEPDKYQRTQQQIQNIKESIGNSLLPTINDMLAVGENVLSKIDNWVGKNQELVRIIMIVVIALGGFLTVGGGIIAVVGGVGLIFTKTAGLIQGFVSVALKLPGLLATATTVLGPLIASVWSFTVALLANPITWIVIGIVALIAGIVLLYNKCEWFRDLVDGIISWISDALGAAFDFIRSIFSGIGNIISTVMGGAAKMVGKHLDNMQTAYREHGGGIKGAAAAAVAGVKGIFSDGYNFLDKLTGGKLSKVTETARQHLDNMKQAYQENGGGIKGLAAAAMEGVKNVYTSGYNFLNDLTSGKLGEIGGKFKEGLDKVKNLISNSFRWFRESGKKVLLTFTEGIASTVMAPVKAVKDGLQKIRNMLPFSDAKTGPLDSLTLSGSRVMSTLSTGIAQTEDMPAEAVERGFERIDLAATNKNLYRGNVTAGKKASATANQEESGEKDTERKKGTVIQNLHIHVDLNKIKELPKLIRLVEEIEEYTNSRVNGTEDDVVLV